ncbi:hypothetical protein KBD08_00595 [Candidatus Babeliales bacterium]|nr:hypothetical protein [Candidatus Babeliales bacterium]
MNHRFVAWYAILALTATTVTISELNAKHTVTSVAPSAVTQLYDIFYRDNVSSLKAFIKENPTFAWNTHYLNLPWSQEYATPLIAATWLNAANCLRYLLYHNTGGIKSSIADTSSRNLTALHYAQHPPAFTKKHMNKNHKIIGLLKQYS